MNKPLGGKLISRILDKKEARKALLLDLPRIEIKEEKIAEIKNISSGVYSPLEGFIGSKDFDSILKRMRLVSGIFWPIPIILDISKKEADKISRQNKIFLTNNNKIIAIMEVEETYSFDKKFFCTHIFKTQNPAHPGVEKTQKMGEYLIGGKIKLIRWDKNPFPKYNLTPFQTREFFKKMGWKNVVGFHTRNVPHRGHEHIQREGLKKTDGIFLNPLIGYKKKGDFKNEVVMRSYVYQMNRVLPRGKSVLSILHYNPYYAGPREAALTAVIRKNFGCSHFIIGRDHTGVGGFYKPADYEHMLKKHQKEMGIKILHFTNAFFCKKCHSMTFEDLCIHKDNDRIYPSGTVIRNALLHKKPLPKEIIDPGILKILFREKELFI